MLLMVRFIFLLFSFHLIFLFFSRSKQTNRMQQNKKQKKEISQDNQDTDIFRLKNSFTASMH